MVKWPAIGHSSQELGEPSSSSTHRQQLHGPLGGVLPFSFRDSLIRSSVGVSNGYRNIRTHENDQAGPTGKAGCTRMSLQIDGLLNMEVLTAIENIYCNMNDWKSLLGQDSIAYFVGKKESRLEDDDLIKIIQLLEKIVFGNGNADPRSEQHKVEIIVASLQIPNLVTKIILKCDWLQGDFVRSLDTEFPFRFFFSLSKISQFAMEKSKYPALAFLNNVLPSILNVLGFVNSENVPAPFTLETFQKFKDIKKRKDEIEEEIKSRKENLMQRYGQIGMIDDADAHDVEAPDDFQCIPVVPTFGELLSDRVPFLRSNLVLGPYRNAHHYQDVQFRLFREDFVHPLKLAIQEYRMFIAIDRKSKPKLDNVRVYRNVKLLSIKTIGRQVVQKIKLDENDFRRVKWNQSKRLINGSLVIFVSDNFKTSFFATVSHRNDEELRNGIFGIQWEVESVTKMFPREGRTFTMFEPTILFEAYRYTLEALKTIRLASFTLSKFILYASANVGPPKYLSEATSPMKLREKYIRPLSASNWPAADALEMDVKQYEAFQACLTKELAIVQGPPGTGKTYLGLQVVATLLENISLWNSGIEKCPILIVCYTNHALDQFLEGILTLFEKRSMEPKMIRIGSMSKSERVQKFALHEVKKRMKENKGNRGHVHDQAYLKRRDEAFEKCRLAKEAYDLYDNEHKELQHLPALIDLSAIRSNKALREEIPPAVFEYFRDPQWFGFEPSVFSENPNCVSLVEQIFGTKGTVRRAPPPVRATEPQSAEGETEDPQHQCSYPLFALNEERLRKAISSAKKKLKEHQVFEPDDVEYIEKLTNDLANSIGEQESWDSFIYFTKEVLCQYDQDLISAIPEAMKKLESCDHNSPLKAKWSVYFSVLYRARNLAQESKQQAFLKLQKVQDQLDKVLKEGDAKLLKESLIVGMTTTGAAKNNEMLRSMRPKIVIVEEAAEVLEAHIVTCLTEWCEQLILIGDHQQLRPSVNVYELCTQYSLDVSMFERLVQNGLPCNTINVQHRMRPCIADLVSGGTIYAELYNAPRVYDYPKVLGTVKDLYFFTHEEPETSVAESDSKSKSNQFEVAFVVQLCLHFLAQGYSPDQVTILTTYRGQDFLIRNDMKRMVKDSGVRVTCVDNYQGEESDIIILSLVRSSKNGSIGFVSTDNRICVALSRAKHGMFIIGNMRLLSLKSQTWKTIREKLNRERSVGTTLQLQCQVHGTVTDVSHPEDFLQKAPNGGCLSKCGAELSCGHVCAEKCHIQDKNHENYKCKEPCTKFCKREQHKCHFPCFMKCSPCASQVPKHLPCGHDQMVKCSEYDEETLCRTYVEKLLPCGHSDEIHCCKDPDKHSCKHDITIPLVCGHDFPTMCFKRDHPAFCLELVKKQLPCEHEADVHCSKDVTDVKCQAPVTKLFDCGHEKEFPCSNDTSKEICQAEVERKLACGHSHRIECSLDASSITCNQPVNITFTACSHIDRVECNEAKNAKCWQRCNYEMACKHPCSHVCHKGVDDEHKNQTCPEPCPRQCSKGHPCAVPREKAHWCSLPCPPCRVSVKKKLPCGHMQKTFCSATEKDLPICAGEKNCKKNLDCGHKCKNLCIEPCGPCTELVEMEGECGHTVKVKCGQPVSSEKCTVLVESTLASPCGHKVWITCHEAGKVSTDYLVTICETPCNYSFKEDIDAGCTHKCKGTCSSCRQGKAHVKCKSVCRKLLFCGHKCTAPCSKPCPPCNKACLMHCEHTKCIGKCGQKCYGCAELCDWKCMHQKCTQFCSSLCDRTPCNHSCRKSLGCGHACIGFCGEPCPPLCRTCDAKKLQQLGSSTQSGLSDMKFVFLEDCDHTIDFPTLERYMRAPGERVEPKFCPLPDCKRLITKSRRYGNIIKTWMTNVHAVKKERDALELQVQEGIASILKSLHAIRCPSALVFVKEFCKQKLSFKYTKKSPKATRHIKQLDSTSVMSIDIIRNYLEEMNEVLSLQLRKNRELQAKILSAGVIVFKRMIKLKLPFSFSDYKSFEKELNRVYGMAKLSPRKWPRARIVGAHNLPGTQWFICEKNHVYFSSVLDDPLKIGCMKCLASESEASSTNSGVQQYNESADPPVPLPSRLEASFAKLGIS